ncbi:hypothetical protein P3X46_031846 [Hevea brasiliensis]|uniref:SHSP domain-containing protein n=1 Tax=Hevea brasiliensis TaxID=3981 RepID=A0ABQ9KPN1_HEVBR|nr:18.1 kDa class I heat shock protein [Hevea brasiliensis]KAJ9141298.1 hypothetical protein P3X46_031846 [Hevea brasiliensis]
MSIVPISDQAGAISNRYSSDLWDPEGFFSSLNLWDPFLNFPFPFQSSIVSTHFPSLAGEIFPSLETHVDWQETPRAHVFRAVFRGLNREDVLVFIDDDNTLQVSTENGKFMSKFKLPENARRDQIKAAMVNGVLTVTIPKEGARSPSVRSIEISGSG